MIPLIIGCCSAGSFKQSTPSLFTVSSDGTKTLTSGTDGSPHIVDWGDGVVEEVWLDSVTHTYTTPGTFYGSVRKSLGRLSLYGDALISVENIQDGLLDFSLGGGSPPAECVNLVAVPSILPASIQNFSFSRCYAFNQDISGWDVSNVTDMNGAFRYCTSFNQDISGWDVSNVTIMSGMFTSATSFNQDLSGWCVSNISSRPNFFSDGATAWVLPKPVWGTCPA